MKLTKSPGRRFSSVEPLEARIAPAALTRFSAGQVDSTLDIDYDDATNAFEESVFISTNDPSDPIGAVVGPGAYYMKLSTGDLLQLVNEASISPLISGDVRGEAGVKGNMIAFFVDKNSDNNVQPNELVGLSLGNKVNVVISGTVDGDVVTNLRDSNFTLGGTELLKNATGKLSIAGDVTGSVVSGGTISGVNVTGRVTQVLAGSAANGYIYDFNGSVNPDGGDTLVVTQAAKEKGVAITKSSFGNITNLIAGDGGAGAVGGAVSLITLRGDQDGFTIQAGNGGAGGGSSINGGAGGGISSIIVNGLAGSAADLTLNDQVIIRSGAGGDAAGNGKGGAGGTVQNLFVSFEGAAGQRAPQRSATPIADDVLVEAGSGGDGRIGGAGGSFRGVDVFAAPGGLGNDLQLIAGAGGTGTSAKGGNGGSITNAFVLNSNVSAEAGFEGADSQIILRAGAGGAASAGVGGLGGSLSGLELTGFNADLGAGAGGNGLKKAGNGGSLKTTLISDGGLSAQPENVTLNAGLGGSATSGKGGNGGSVSGFRILNSDLETLVINGAVGAANGGASGRGTGGKGGSVSKLEITESDSGNAGVATIRAGSGGNGGTSAPQGGAGGVGGSVSSITLRAVQLDLTVNAGDGGDATVKGAGGKAGSVSQMFFSSFRQAGGTDVTATFVSGSGGDGAFASKAGAGGDVSRVNVVLGREQQVLRDDGQVSLIDGGAVIVTAGSGGASGSGAAGAGGSIISSNFTTFAGDISLTAGDAGLAGGKAGKGGRIQSASLELATSVTLLSGDGRSGGAGGDIRNIGFSRSVEDTPIQNFQATIQEGPGGSPLGAVTVIAGAGSGLGRAAGNGGSIIDVAGFVGAGVFGENSLSLFQAGAGGSGSTKAGNGGSINGLSLFGGGGDTAELRVVAGHAGDAPSASRGATGGSVVNVGIGVNAFDTLNPFNPDNTFAITPGTIIRHVAAGDGGDASGRAGVGGSITGLNASYDIGVRSGEGFGFSTMGGIFAGVGGTGGSAGASGRVVNVTADAIAAIVAGRLEVGDTVQQQNLVSVVDRIILNSLENPTETDAVGNYTNFDTASVLGGVVDPLDPTSVPYTETEPTNDPLSAPHANTFDAGIDFIDSGDGVFGIGDVITARTDGFVAAIDFIGNLTNVRAEALLTIQNGSPTFIDLNNTNGQERATGA